MTAKTIKLLHAALYLVALTALPGCSQWYFDLGEPLRQANLPPADEGAQVRDVLTVLGPPHRISADANGYILAWEYWQVRENAVGFSLSPIGLDFLSADVARVDAEGEFLLATFDGDHTLTSLSFSEWNNRMGDGQALQPFGALDVAETGDLVSGFGAVHRSGAAMLRRLPTALNSGSDISSGEHGLEQRATPDDLGQRSLEMR